MANKNDPKTRANSKKADAIIGVCGHKLTRTLKVKGFKNSFVWLCETENWVERAKQ